MWWILCFTTRLMMFVCYLRWHKCICKYVFFQVQNQLITFNNKHWESIFLFMYQILLAGVHFEDNGEFSVQDAELASLRKAKNLKVICEEIIPRKLTDILRLTSNLSNHTGPLQPNDFECTLLTLVYTTQQVVRSTSEQQRDVWQESFVSLYKAIKQDLTGTN